MDIMTRVKPTKSVNMLRCNGFRCPLSICRRADGSARLVMNESPFFRPARTRASSMQPPPPPVNGIPDSMHFLAQALPDDRHRESTDPNPRAVAVTPAFVHALAVPGTR